jgi:hypothetical protein
MAGRGPDPGKGEVRRVVKNELTGGHNQVARGVKAGRSRIMEVGKRSIMKGVQGKSET